MGANLAAALGRLLLSAIFIMAGIHKLTAWNETAASMQGEGMILVPLMLTGAVLLELGGGLALLLGFCTRVAAAGLIVFLIPTTLIFHDFWTYTGSAQQEQMMHFMKNVSILGGVFFALAFGAGAWSIDGLLTKSSRQHAEEPQAIGVA